MKTGFIKLSLFVVALTLLMGTQVFAQDGYIKHDVDYFMDGHILYNKQSGHLCNTGAEVKQSINGVGEIIKTTSIYIIEGVISIDDNNDLVTDLDAVEKLNVSTAIKLCAPPKTYIDYNSLITVVEYVWHHEPLLNDSLWLMYWEEVYEYHWVFAGEGNPLDVNPDWDDYFYTIPWETHPVVELTEQVWAVSITPEPGYSGVLNTDFTAAYGLANNPIFVTDDSELGKDRWAYTDQGIIKSGPDYVGDYFNIEQFAFIEFGEMKRFIDISSPLSHAMLHEYMTILGTAEVAESFSAENVIPGSETEDNWVSISTGNNSNITSTLVKDRYLHHLASYLIDGDIELEKQAGHLCNTGAEMKQSISGTGTLAKSMDIYMIAGLLEVKDRNEFTTALDAAKNMTITSAIELCAPPKQIFDSDTAWLSYFSIDEPISEALSADLSPTTNGFRFNSGDLFIGFNDILVFGPYFPGDVINPLLYPGGLYSRYPDGPVYSRDVSKQIWATSVTATPGHHGMLDMAFEAAYGPYGGYFNNPEGVIKASESFWYTQDHQAAPDNWWVSTDGAGIFPVVGKDYVGNFFRIDQLASTSNGILKRFIDISSPWSHAYVYENTEVSGMAEVKEAFEMNNLPPGGDMNGEWWNLSSSETFTPVYDYYLPGLYLENVSGITTNVEMLLFAWSIHTLFHYNSPGLIDSFIDEFFSTGDEFGWSLIYRWDDILDWMEVNIEGFDRKSAPHPKNFTYLDPFIIHDIPLTFFFFL